MLQEKKLPKYKLGEEQEEALSRIKDFVKNSKEISFSLFGPAGTGNL